MSKNHLAANERDEGESFVLNGKEWYEREG